MPATQGAPGTRTASPQQPVLRRRAACSWLVNTHLQRGHLGGTSVTGLPVSCVLFHTWPIPELRLQGLGSRNKKTRGIYLQP